MLVVNTQKITATGASLPITIRLEKVEPSKLIEHQTMDIKLRNSWCTHDKPCAKYDTRPCCPPRVKLFSEFPKHSYVYLFLVSLSYENYLEFSPKTKASKNPMFLFMSGSHKITRGIANGISTSFRGQAFRVGGCLGCSYSKNRKCRRLCPALEGTGINVVELTSDIFGIDIEWYKPKSEVTVMRALSAIYTDETITKSKFKEVIRNVCQL